MFLASYFFQIFMPLGISYWTVREKLYSYLFYHYIFNICYLFKYLINIQFLFYNGIWLICNAYQLFSRRLERGTLVKPVLHFCNHFFKKSCIKGVDQFEHFKNQFFLHNFTPRGVRNSVRQKFPTVLVLLIKSKFMKTKFYRVLELIALFSKPCFPSRLPGLSRVKWMNSVELVFLTIHSHNSRSWRSGFSKFSFIQFLPLVYNEKKKKKTKKKRLFENVARILVILRISKKPYVRTSTTWL